MLAYTIGAGITAAAGTRLALQLLINKIPALFSIQLFNPKAKDWDFLSLPLDIRIG